MDGLKINMETANKLQDFTLLNKGLSILSEIYKDYKSGNTRVLDATEKDAIEYFLTSTQRKYAENIKQITDDLI